MSNTTGVSPLLTASLSHFLAERDRVLAELDIYLNRPVGTGNNSSVTEEVFSLFKKLNEAQSTLELIKEIIANSGQGLALASLITDLNNKLALSPQPSSEDTTQKQ